MYCYDVQMLSFVFAVAAGNRVTRSDSIMGCILFLCLYHGRFESELSFFYQDKKEHRLFLPLCK